MENDKTKLLFVISIACLVILSGIFLWGSLMTRRASVYTENPDIGDQLIVTNLAVGKGDAAVIRYKTYTGLIDTGSAESFRILDTWFKENNIATIDFLILSHYDQDHVGSVMQLLQNYPVRAIYYPDYESEKKYYEPLMAEFAEREGAEAIRTAMTLNVSDLTIELLPADDAGMYTDQADDPDNDMSLLCRLNYGSNRLLFTGDIEKDRMEQLVESDLDLSADWIKIPHHGEYHKNEKDFLKCVKPAYAVISTSANNAPDEELLKYLEKKDITYFTTIDGNVVTICDGTTIQIEQ